MPCTRYALSPKCYIKNNGKLKKRDKTHFMCFSIADGRNTEVVILVRVKSKILKKQNIDKLQRGFNTSKGLD